AISPVLRRMALFPTITSEIVRDLYRLGSSRVLPWARRHAREPFDSAQVGSPCWGLKSESTQSTRFWSAMILLRDGDHARDEGSREIGELLSVEYDCSWTRQLSDEFLALDGVQVAPLLCEAFTCEVSAPTRAAVVQWNDVLTAGTFSGEDAGPL